MTATETPMKASVNLTDAKTLIAASGLPQEVRQLIATVVKRTRLWKRERAEVAVELIAHFLDGIEAGRNADDLVKTFGDVKTSAKLIRRAKKRNRPLMWRAMVRLTQAVGLLVLLYLGAAVLLMTRHPVVSVDYVAEINRAPSQAKPEDCAWPIYRKAWIADPIDKVDTEELWWKDPDTGIRTRPLRPGDVDWPKVRAFIERHHGLLVAARAGGSKPFLGLCVGHDQDFSQEDAKTFGWQERHKPAAPAKHIDELRDGSVLLVLLPHLNGMREMANLLVADMHLATDERDGQRIVTDYVALLGIAHQSREVSCLVDQLACLGILQIGDAAIARIHREHPEVLAAQRVPLLHAMGSRCEALLAIDVGAERIFLDDTIQRTYSDDGGGDGRMTAEGLELLTTTIRTVASSGSDRQSTLVDATPVAPLLAPMAAGVMPSRRELNQQVAQYFALAERDARRPLWEKLRQVGAADQMLQNWRIDQFGSMRYAMLAILLPSNTRAAQSFDVTRAEHEALMVALALDSYREKHGRYPETLAELVPQFYPAMPLDHSTGGPLRYRIKDGRPLLYGLGLDGQDDGGEVDPKLKPHERSPVPKRGDWVLYPPVPEG